MSAVKEEDVDYFKGILEEFSENVADLFYKVNPNINKNDLDAALNELFVSIEYAIISKLALKIAKSHGIVKQESIKITTKADKNKN